ncbi:MAG: response regulator [Planctomycetota bacterium]
MKLLIVDDSKAMRMILIRTLKKTSLGDFTIVEASSGPQALELLEKESPDMILSDWNMPEMKGIELLQKIRESGNNIRFGFVTSEGSDETKQLAMDSGAAFVLTKPFTADSMQAVLEPVLS